MSGTRVLDPEGALAGQATRLDPVGPTAAHEQVLALEALVLGPAGADLAAGRDEAGLARALEDRGGLPRSARDAALVLRDGERRVVLLAGVRSVPLWARPRLDARVPALVHLEGHAVVERSHRRWVVRGDDGPLAAVADAVAAHVRAVVADLARPLVVLGQGPHVATAVRACLAGGRPAVTTAGTLGEAQELDAAGARVVVDLGGTPAGALATLRSAAADLPASHGVLLVGRVPPLGAAPDGDGDHPWARLAGMLGPRVDVVGSVDVDSLTAGAGATVVLHGAGGPADTTATAPAGGASWD